LQDWLSWLLEHLINQQPYKPIAIVESEKTAIISSIYFSGFLWLATGGKNGMKLKEYPVLKPLSDRKIILFPDFGLPDSTGKTPYQKWLQVAKHIQNTITCDISVSSMLEDTLSNDARPLDMDLADVLIRKDPATGLALYEEVISLKDYININDII
jgi:hypothetical protein